MARSSTRSAGAVDQAVDQLVGLAAAAPDELGEQLGGVVTRHPPARDGVVEHLLDALAREHQRLERVEQADRLRTAVLADAWTEACRAMALPRLCSV